MTWIDWLISGILFFIMLSVRLSLSSRSFIVTFARPKAFFLGLFLQIIFLPIMAFSVVYFSDLPLAFRVGIVILAACPGGMTSNFISYLLNANAALSIALTVTNSFIALVSIPFIVNLSLGFFLDEGASIQLSVWETIRQIFTVTIVPVFIGLFLRRRDPERAIRLERNLKWITVFLLAILFLIKFFAGEDQGGTGITIAEIGQILPYSMLVNALGLLSGYFAGRLFTMDRSNQLTLGVEVGIQNTSLAFLIATTMIGDEDMLKPALIYAMFTFFSALLYGLWVKPEQRKRVAEQFYSWLRSWGR